MKVEYINSEITDSVARVTVIGRGARGQVRRPVIDLNAFNLGAFIKVAQKFRDHQLRLAAMHTSRAETINLSLKESTT
jgi:hypothetical protein